MAYSTPLLRTLFLLPLVAVLAAPPATAQNRSPSGIPSLEGSTLQKQPFQLAALKGKVVLLMFWSTDCPVCRDQMAELRENVQGWANKPFELVLVSVDRRVADLNNYNAIISTSVPVKQRFTQLWAGEAGFKDNLGTLQLPKNQLPATFLIDKTGKLVERYNGRVPAQAWDAIADLL